MYSKNQQQDFQKRTQQLLAPNGTQAKDAGAKTQLVQELVSVINYHDWRYYVLSEPVIQDTDYDFLFDTLKNLEESNPDLLLPDSPTQRVAQGLSNDFPTVAHTIPMLSLAKAYNDEQILEWDVKVKKLAQSEEITYAVEPKFDGASFAVIYENDLLVRGATRGNGTTGDDITNNVKTIPSVPLRANFSKYGLQKVELRGEVVIDKKQFVEINKLRAEKGEQLLSNPRNSASGALRQKHPEKVMERRLEAFVYQMGAAIDANGRDVMGSVVESHEATMKMLYDLGFKTPLKSADDTSHIHGSIEDVIGYINGWRATRDDYNYEIDGIVIKVNNLKTQELVGATGHHPRWAVALKFDARQATTILENIEFQVGRTGAVTPVAKLKTVNLAGANISNVSLHNEDFIKEKDIRIGDTVVVIRSGDVIPYIQEVVVAKRTGEEIPVEFPSECPVCSEGTVKEEGGSAWKCVNYDCAAQVEERLIHFASKKAMDIRGLGKDIIKRFFREGRLKTITDIYRLNYGAIKNLDGWGEKSATKLKNSVEASKNQSLQRLIVGLGIKEVGRSTSKMLMEHISDLEDLKEWSAEKLQELPDIGPKVAANLEAFFQSERSLQLIEELKELGINTKRQETAKAAPSSNKLEGKTFLFTGSLQQFTRKDAQGMVEENGGKLLSGVSKKLNYLVVGEKAGSKLKKAQQIETITILTEDEFLALIA